MRTIYFSSVSFRRYLTCTKIKFVKFLPNSKQSYHSSTISFVRNIIDDLRIFIENVSDDKSNFSGLQKEFVTIIDDLEVNFFETLVNVLPATDLYFNTRWRNLSVSELRRKVRFISFVRCRVNLSNSIGRNEIILRSAVVCVAFRSNFGI